MALYRITEKCDCRKYYIGDEDKLSRISPIVSLEGGSQRSLESPLHFVSYDMLFEYHASLISGGNTQNSFVQSKNDVNVVFRGNNNELPNRFLTKLMKYSYILWFTMLKRHGIAHSALVDLIQNLADMKGIMMRLNVIFQME